MNLRKKNKHGKYQVSPMGNAIICIMKGIDAKVLGNHDFLDSLFMRELKRDRFTIIKHDSHAFNSQGFTAFSLLGESHAALHTYPEYGTLVLDIYSCRGSRDARKTVDRICSILKPRKADYHDIAVNVSPLPED